MKLRRYFLITVITIMALALINVGAMTGVAQQNPTTTPTTGTPTTTPTTGTPPTVGPPPTTGPVVDPNIGVFGAKSILENSQEANAASEAAMQRMWEDIFGGSNVLYQTVVAVATGFLGLFFLLTILPILNDAGQYNWRGVGSRFAWIIVVAVLLANNATFTRGLSLGIRGVMNETASFVLDTQFAQITMRDAVNDSLISYDVRAQIYTFVSDCDSKEGQEQISCFLEGARNAQIMIDEQLAKYKSPGLARLSNRMLQEIAELQNRANNNNAVTANVNVLRGSSSALLKGGSRAAAGGILKSIQQAFVYGLELSMLLTALLAPLAASASLMPFTPRPIFSWLIAFVGLGFMKFTYNLLVAFCAVWLVTSKQQDAGDIVGLLLMAIASPLIAMSLTAWGGAAILTGISRATATAISVVPVPGLRR